MTYLRASAYTEQVNPKAIHAFFDKVALWLRDPLDEAELAYLKSFCGAGGLHVFNGAARFDRQFVQRLQLHQVSTEGLRWLAQARPQNSLNYCELSLDWILASEDERDAAYEFVCRFLVKPHHRDQIVRFCGKNDETRYSGPRRAPNVIVVYRDRPSKVNQEPYCVHFDWRMRGVRTLRRVGINSLYDLLNKDIRNFWGDRLLLLAIDPTSLGREYFKVFRNVVRREYIRRYPSGFQYDVFLRAGQTILRSWGSTQAVFDMYRKRMNLRTAIRRLPIDHLLPTPSYD